MDEQQPLNKSQNVASFLKDFGSELSKLQKEYDSGHTIQKLERQRTQEIHQLQVEEQKDILKMRRRWSTWLLVFVGFIVLADIFVIFFLGFGLMSFTQGYVVPFFVGDSLIKVIGLSLIVVLFLFDRKR